MKSKLKREIREARPNLKDVSPMSYWFIMLMGVFNLFIGMAFIIALKDVDDPVFNVITQVIPFWLWGVIFFALGIAELYSLKVNSWKLARKTLLTGVTLKSGWAVALTLKTLIAAPDNAFLTACWVAIAVTQVICYVHFLPPQEMRLFSGKKMEQ